MDRDAYWMVHRKGSSTTQMHCDEQIARNEAERIARNCPGTDIYVLQAVAYVRCNAPIEWGATIEVNPPF